MIKLSVCFHLRPSLTSFINDPSKGGVLISPGIQGLSEDTWEEKLAFLSSAADLVGTRLHYVFAGGCEGIQNDEKDLRRTHTCSLMFEAYLYWRLQIKAETATMTEQNEQASGSKLTFFIWPGVDV